MAKKNLIKAEVKAELLKQFPEDIVKKGMARAERWISAAYSSAGIEGYQDRLDESADMAGLVSFFAYYCREAIQTQAPGAKTFNREAFGIYKK